MLTRRGFIFGAGTFAIVQPEIIMPIKSIIEPNWRSIHWTYDGKVMVIDSLTMLSDMLMERNYDLPRS